MTCTLLPKVILVVLMKINERNGNEGTYVKRSFPLLDYHYYFDFV